MRIIVTDEDGENYEYEFDQEKVILGRGNKCDITIQSDHISRKHLEIKFIDGIFYIRDMTLANWVSYNDEKLVKSSEIQYFDFAPLILPGGFKVKIEDESAVDDLEAGLTATSTLSTNFDKTKTGSSKIDIYNTKLSRDSTLTGYKRQRIEEKRKRKLEKEEQKSL